MPRPGPPAPRTESSLIVCPSNECRAWWPPHILNPSVILTPHKLLATPPTQPTHQRNFHPSYLLSDRPVNPSQQSRRAVDWPDQATAVVISRKYLGAVGCNSCRASHHSDQSQPPAPLSPYRHISNRSAMMVSRPAPETTYFHSAFPPTGRVSDIAGRAVQLAALAGDNCLFSPG